eukprot:363469-Chlamydomonas_euryale.AAC.1
MAHGTWHMQAVAGWLAWRMAHGTCSIAMQPRRSDAAMAAMAERCSHVHMVSTAHAPSSFVQCAVA